MFKRALLALALGGLTLTQAATALAQSYPTRPIRIVVPYAAGGGTDVVARALGERLSKRLGQPVIVDNKAGASGIIGTDMVAKAAPDGHTLLVTLTQSVLTNQFLYAKLPYDPRKDLTLISVIADAPLVLAVPASLPVRSVRELADYGRAHPGKVTYGSWGVGSYPHLTGAYFSRDNGGDMVHAPYKGEAPMLQDLLGGQLQFAVASVLSARPHIEAGKLRPLAVTGTQRAAALPDVPTFAEAGMDDGVYKTLGWIGLLAPAGTPPAIVARLDEVLRAEVRTPEMQARFAALALRPIAGTPAQAQALYARDWPILKMLVADSGARLE